MIATDVIGALAAVRAAAHHARARRVARDAGDHGEGEILR
jgi:hypothetical protein